MATLPGLTQAATVVDASDSAYRKNWLGVETVDVVAQRLPRLVVQRDLQGGVAGQDGAVVHQGGVKLDAIGAVPQGERVKGEHAGATGLEAHVEAFGNNQRVVASLPASRSARVAAAVRSTGTSLTGGGAGGTRGAVATSVRARISLLRAARTGQGEQGSGREDEEKLRPPPVHRNILNIRTLGVEAPGPARGRVRLPPASAVATVPGRWPQTKGCSSLPAPSRRRGGGDSCGSPGGPRRPCASRFANPTPSPAARAAMKKRWRKRAAPQACRWSRFEPYWARAWARVLLGRPPWGVRAEGAAGGLRSPPLERPLEHDDDGRRSGHHDLDLGDARHHRARHGRRVEARLSPARSRHPPRSGRRCGGLPPGAARVQGGPAPDRPPPHAHPSRRLDFDAWQANRLPFIRGTASRPPRGRPWAGAT